MLVSAGAGDDFKICFLKKDPEFIESGKHHYKGSNFFSRSSRKLSTQYTSSAQNFQTRYVSLLHGKFDFTISSKKLTYLMLADWSHVLQDNVRSSFSK